jgi:hypothetical protein
MLLCFVLFCTRECSRGDWNNLLPVYAYVFTCGMYVLQDSIAEVYGEESPELDRYVRAIGEENVPPGWWDAADVEGH